jgi:hypothetical protein
MSNRSAVPTRPRNDGLHGARELPEDVAGTATCARQSGERPDTTGSTTMATTTAITPATITTATTAIEQWPCMGKCKGTGGSGPAPPGPLPTGQLTPPPLP